MDWKMAHESLRLTCYLIPPSRVFVESGSKHRRVLFGYFLLLLSYSTWTCKAEIFGCSQMYTKKPWSILESLGVDLELLWIVKAYWRWIVRMSHMFSSPPPQKKNYVGYWAWNCEHVVQFFWVDVFWVFVLRFVVDHPPFKYICLMKIRNPIHVGAFTVGVLLLGHMT